MDIRLVHHPAGDRMQAAPPERAGREALHVGGFDPEQSIADADAADQFDPPGRRRDGDEHYLPVDIRDLDADVRRRPHIRESRISR
ncbi:hypothetical protein [Methylobacterium sp. A54F]